LVIRAEPCLSNGCVFQETRVAHPLPIMVTHPLASLLTDTVLHKGLALHQEPQTMFEYSWTIGTVLTQRGWNMAFNACGKEHGLQM
jgi:hypothetical protein